MMRAAALAVVLVLCLPGAASADATVNSGGANQCYAERPNFSTKAQITLTNRSVSGTVSAFKTVFGVKCVTGKNLPPGSIGVRVLVAVQTGVNQYSMCYLGPQIYNGKNASKATSSLTIGHPWCGLYHAHRAVVMASIRDTNGVTYTHTLGTGDVVFTW